MRATIEDVARASGTSKKTVSRVLNNEPNVRESMRERVLAAMSALKYRPLASARSLATNMSGPATETGIIDFAQSGSSTLP